MPKLNLYDIKELSEVPDSSFYIFIVLILVLIAIIISLIIMFKIKKQNQKNTFKEYAIAKILDLDLNDTKKSAYIISKYGRVLVYDNRTKKLFEELFMALEKYKYMQIVPRFEKDIYIKLQLYKEAVGIDHRG